MRKPQLDFASIAKYIKNESDLIEERQRTSYEGKEDAD